MNYTVLDTSNQAVPFPLPQESLYTCLENMSDAVVAVDSSWNYTYVNKKMSDWTGYAQEDLLGKQLWTVFPNLIDTPFYRAAHQALQLQQFCEMVDYNEILEKWIEKKIYPSEKGLLILLSDVTEKKGAEQKAEKAQKELEDFKAALSITSMVAVTDTEGTISWVNDNFCKTSQYTSTELAGNKHGLLNPANHSPEVYEEIKEAFSKGLAWQGEMKNSTKDGSTIWVHSVVVPFHDKEGKPSHNFVICQDITEKKKAARALAESERLYRSLIENYSDPVFVTDLQGNITKANQRAAAVFALTTEELQQKNFLEFLSKSDRDTISTSLPMLLQGKNLKFKTVISSFADRYTAIVAVVPIKDEGETSRLFVKFRDVTQQLDYERDLKLLNETTLALSTSPNLKEGVSSVISLLCQYGSFQYGEFWMPLFGQPLFKMKSSWWASSRFRIMKAASEYKTFNINTDKPHILGTNKWFYSGNLQEDPNFRRKPEATSCGLNSFMSVPVVYRNQLLGVFTLFSTAAGANPSVDPERLQEMMGKLGGELERRQRDEELNKFFNVSPMLMGIFSFDGQVKKCNPAFHRVLGYTEEEAKNLYIPELVHPEDRTRIEAVREKIHQGQSLSNLEVRYRCKDGSYRWFAITTQSLPEENLTYLAAQDIHEHKLQTEEFERVKIAIDATSDAIGIAADMEHLLYVNHSFERLLGWTTEKLNAIGWPSVFVSPALPYQIVEIISEKGKWEGDLQLFDTKGNIRDFNLRANSFLNQQGGIKFLVGIFTDIAEQKKARQELVRLNKAVEESANEVYILEPKMLRFIYANKLAQLNLGYSSEEILKLLPYDLNPQYNKLSYLRLLIPLLKGKVKNLTFRTMHSRKNGEQYPVEVHLSWFQDGQDSALMVQVIDITEQKKAEDVILLSSERFQLITKATNDAIWDWDVVKQICYYGEGYKTIFGHSFGNTYAGVESWTENIHPDDLDRVVGNFHRARISKVKEWVIEYRFRCADNSYKFVKDRGHVIFDKTGKAVRMAGALSDITEHKKSEALLKEFNTELAKKVEEKTSKLGHALRLMRQEVIARVRTEETLHQSLKEKEVLLKEIHHRVKNNMAIISGLLSLQTRHAKHPELKVMLKDSQSRIKSMALIHELLYQNENLSRINFKAYIYELTAGISSSFLNKDKVVDIEIEADEEELDIIQAVPCALILNELLTNSFKYAFANQQKGCVFIGFKHTASQYILTVADNGAGLPADFNISSAKTLGMQLVTNLVRQIGGKFSVVNHEPGKGAKFSIVW